jgi:HD-GYP domain-containing protein (c-di-GMP phosphodiesterase class II)
MIIAPRVEGIYIGYENNDFYEVINLKNNHTLTKLYDAPKQSAFAAITIINDLKYKKIKFLDKNLNTLNTYQLKKDFIVKSRPWYKKAITQKEAVVTDVYKFKSTKKPGITFAQHIQNTKAVVAIDYTLDDLNTFLEEQNFNEKSYIMLYQDSGQQIAVSRKISKKSWDILISFFKKHPHEKIKTLIHDGIEYFTYHTISDKNINIHIGVLIPKKSLLDPYIQKIIYSLYAAFTFVILTIPLIFYSTSKIINPIRALMAENKKITNRDFKNITMVKTNILELHQLSISLVSMSKSIQEYQKSQEKLLDAIIKLIAQAIDAKSTYTGGHCKRVPQIAEMLAKAANDDNNFFKNFSFHTEDNWREFHLGAWLHDCGKVTTPEYVVDKATKLETIYNRIHEIRTRFEVLFRDAQIEYFESILQGEDKEKAEKTLHAKQKQLKDDFAFIASANIGGEFMDEKMQDRVKEIGDYEWVRNFDDRLGLSEVELLRYKNTQPASLPAKEKLLSDKPEHIITRVDFDYEAYKAEGFKEDVPEYLYNYGEIYNLCLPKGTLTPEERFKINEHVIMSIRMLEQIPFPKQLQRIPEYAGTHHETMIGTGYPKQLTKDELSIPSRIMAIADIFEALTASDRPYKKAKTLCESLKIMSMMAKEKHIDKELFNLFLKSDIYLEYAKTHLKPEQIDKVDIAEYLI